MRQFLPLVFSLFFFQNMALSQNPNIFFNTVLRSSEVVPATNSNGTGMISLLFNADRTKIKVSGLLTNLDGAVTSAILHLGKKGATGAAVIDLTPYIIGRKIEGEVDFVPAHLLPNLFLDNIYCEIKTTAHAAGELRGQLLAETDVNFNMIFDAKNMVPAVNSPAVGIGCFHFPVGSEDILYLFGMREMSGEITGATIFRGQPGEIGVKVADLLVNPPANFVINVVEIDELEPDFVENCRAGKYFVVLKTAAFPDGEARAQVRFTGFLNSIVAANGNSNVPPNNSLAFGFGFTELTANLDSMKTTMVLNGISPTAAAIRKGKKDEIGAVFFNQTPAAKPGFFETKYPISAADLTDFSENGFYLDFASADFPTGEIRGNMLNSLRKCYAFDLCGSQEIPKNNSTALGMGMFSVDQADCYFNFKTITDGLSGVPTAAGIFSGNDGAVGTKIYTIKKTIPLAEGIQALVTGEGQLVENQGTYLNISTAAFPDGEIRGQIRRELTCPLVTSVSEIGGAEIGVFPNPFSEGFFVKISAENAFGGRLVLTDVLGKRVFEQKILVGGGEQVFEIFEKDLASGIYQVLIENLENGRVIWESKIVKN